MTVVSLIMICSPVQGKVGWISLIANAHWVATQPFISWSHPSEVCTCIGRTRLGRMSAVISGYGTFLRVVANPNQIAVKMHGWSWNRWVISDKSLLRVSNSAFHS